ncbi:MAG TPA: hypothetical protein VIM16_05810 [Mucilaginibacter sp.]|jgi:hypothetical protein
MSEFINVIEASPNEGFDWSDGTIKYFTAEEAARCDLVSTNKVLEETSDIVLQRKLAKGFELVGEVKKTFTGLVKVPNSSKYSAAIHIDVVLRAK